MSNHGDLRISLVLTPWTWWCMVWRYLGSWGLYFGPIELCWTSAAVSAPRCIICNRTTHDDGLGVVDGYCSACDGFR